MSFDLEFIAHMPACLLVMNDNMDLTAASREAFSLFGIRWRPGTCEQSLVELSTALTARHDLIGLIGASTLKLRRPGSRDTFRWEDGKRVFDVVVFTLPPADALQYGVQFIDISVRLESEQDRDSMRNYLEGILDSLPIGIVVTDRDMRITSMNTMQQLMLRFMNKDLSLLQAVGMSAAELFSEETDPSWNEIRKQVLENGETMEGIVRRYSTAGSERIFSISLAPLHDIWGKITGAVRISDDITHQKALEDEVHRGEVLAARLETVQQLTVTIKHEINTALTGIVGGIALVRKTGEPVPEDKQPLLDDILQQAGRISDFVGRLAGLKKIKAVDYLKGSDRKMIDLGDEETR